MKVHLTALGLCLCSISFAQYTGTASVTQGTGTTTATNLSSCTGGRVTDLGSVTATDNTVWTVPAQVNYTNTSFPFASDLNNPCNGNTYVNTTAALAALSRNDIVTVESDGEVITAYVFADNYFEMYINGVPVGKDKVPYTQFNSSIVRFKVKRPFTIAMLLVDWEEHLGLGSEASGPLSYHDGDAGMVAVFKDAAGNFIAKTDTNWKAQVFYTAPITDLSCPSEQGNIRLSGSCSTADGNSGANYYGLHWPRPAYWTSDTFNDSHWPRAFTYTNAIVGVNNKPAYTNFPDVFDASGYDAEFIWTSNLVLDNEVLTRYTVQAPTGIKEESGAEENLIRMYPNPAKNELHIELSGNLNWSDKDEIEICNSYGEIVYYSKEISSTIATEGFAKGIYMVKIMAGNKQAYQRLIIE